MNTSKYHSVLHDFVFLLHSCLVVKIVLIVIQLRSEHAQAEIIEGEPAV